MPSACVPTTMDIKTRSAPPRIKSSVWLVIAAAAFVSLQLSGTHVSLYQHHAMSYNSADSAETSWPDSTLSGAYQVGTIVWVSCPRVDDMDTPKGVDCGSVIVPKDYFNASAGISSIAFARLNATEPSKGPLFLNPGGPGGAGMNMLLGLRGKTFTGVFGSMIGHNFDLIGFDPRGIGHTRPATQCFTSDAEATLFNANTVIDQGFTVSSIKNLSSPALLEELIEQNRQFIAIKQSQGELCGKVMGDELKYMGTATVVRDMDFMSGVFGGQGTRINYWGASYGSILGAYLVNMIPDRVGYAVIDGIADPVDWANEPSHKWPTNWLTSTEATYKMYLEDCSRVGCPLARYHGESYRPMIDRFEAFFEKLAISPLATPFSTRPGYLTSGAARGLLLMNLERPINWPSSAVAFAEGMAGNGTLLYNSILSRRGGGSVTRLAISCADAPPPASYNDIPTSMDLAKEMIHAMEAISPHFGASVGLSEPDGGCEYWPTVGKGPERFTGPWNATLDTPLLIVSNTHDPITPLSSGLHINSLMPQSSILLIQVGPGHCSTAMQSLCTMKNVRSYFSGVMPANGTLCDVDNKTFPEENDVVHTLSAEDEKLVEGWRILGEMVFEAKGW